MTARLIIDMASPIRRVVLVTAEGALWSEELAVKADAAVLLPEAIGRLFAQSGLTKADLSGIAANIGPGGLSATRAGIAFANAYAFGLDLPTASLRYLDLLGREAAVRGLDSVLCAKRAANNTGFLGLYRAGRLARQNFGPVEKILPEILAEGPMPQALVGVLPPGGAAFLPKGMTVLEESDAPSIAVLAAAAGVASYGPEPLVPLNELSGDFAEGGGA